ncbi:MAG: RsmD family RNA methyltransferase [bacterium]
MRIISGIHRSRILKSPAGENIRPTSDRAKETLFNILSNRFEFDGIECMDLFCGSGSLGLECISRGAGLCTFVDTDIKLVTMNAEMLGVKDNARIVRSEALNFLSKRNEQNIKIIFCDPPYDYEKYDLLLEKISHIGSVLALEHSDKFILNDKFACYVFQKKKIGTVNFTLFEFTK